MCGANDRTTKGVGRSGIEGGPVGGGAVVRRALRPLRFSLVIARHRGWSRFARSCLGVGVVGASDATHSRVAAGGSGAGRGGGPELGGATAGEGALLLSAAGGGECGECVLDAFGGEVALAEVADLGAGQPVG